MENTYTAINIENNDETAFHPVYDGEVMDPWQQVNEQIETYKRNIQSEKKLIFEVSCPTKNNILRITCGMSMARNFEPVIKIDDWLDVSFTFTEENWNVFLFHLKMMYHQQQENLSFTLEGVEHNLSRVHNTDCYMEQDELICCCCNVKVEVSAKNNTGDVFLYLTKGVMENIFEFEEWIFYRLELLKNLQFGEFYTKFFKCLKPEETPYLIDLKLYCLRDVITHETNKFKNSMHSLV